jgi:uncharacterized OsmC-like protein
MNHVNVESWEKLVEDIKADPANAKIRPKVKGEWVFEEGQPQFRARMDVEGGSYTVESDMPTKLGGWGSAPGPLNYCLYGLASCYAYTFASLATMEGVTLTKLEIEAESHIDVSKTVGLSDNPIVEEVKWTVTVSSDADDAMIEKLKDMAEEKCPAIYCLTNPVKLTIDVDIE